MICNTKNSLFILLYAENQEAESWRLDDTVKKEITRLKNDYATIATKACQCLENHNPSLSAAHTAVWLNEILRGTQDEPLIVEERVSTYSDLFLQLQKKWSFTNPALLKQLLEILENESLSEELAKYTKRFDEACSKFPIDKPVRFEPYDPSQPCLILILSFKSLDVIKVFLKDVFDIYSRYLRIHMITPGSIKQVTIQFPASMTTLVQESIDQKRTANNTSMRIEPQAEDATSETQPTAASNAVEEAVKCEINHKPASTEKISNNTHTTELQFNESKLQEPATLDETINQTKQVIKPFNELHKQETKIPTSECSQISSKRRIT